MADATVLWGACAAAIQSQVSDVVWQMTFTAAQPVTADDETLVVSVPSPLIRDRIEGRPCPHPGLDDGYRIQLFTEALCPLKGKGPEDVDMVIVRENTEGAYSGMHGFMHKGQTLEVSTQTMTYTRQGTERAIRYAFELAMSRNKRKQVTLIDKANAIRAHDLWTRTFREVAEDFPEVKTEHAYIDAACMWMVKNPEWFDVAVTPNLLGDIITDLGAMVQGGMGLAASGNIHPGRVSLFEPIHGSAPKHAGKNVASPVAAIMACSMMLDYLGEKTAATAIESVLRELFRSGRLCGAGTGDHPTNEVGDLVAGELRQPASSV